MQISRKRKCFGARCKIRRARKLLFDMAEKLPKAKLQMAGQEKDSEKDTLLDI